MKGIRVALALFLAAAGPSAVRSQNPSPLDTIRALLRDTRYLEAESGARTLLATTESVSGADSLETAQVLDVLVEALWRGGKVRAPETRRLAERSVAIKTTLLGDAHADVALSLTSLGTVLRLQGDYAQAKSVLERSLRIQENALGGQHPDVARTLTVSAGLAADMGNLSGAQALYERALSIRQQGVSAADPAIADNLNGLGVVRERMGDAVGAERYHERALEMREQVLGPAHPDVAASLNNLANVRNDMGDYTTARSLHERALDIRERALGPDHPDVAASLNNLAITVRDLGDHAAAWWLLERVLAIWEKAFGPDHPNLAVACQNLASVLVDLGDDAGTALLTERARRVRVGGQTGRLAASLNTLIGLDSPRGNAAARALLQRALSIKEKALGPSHPSVALTLTSLATITRKIGITDGVRALYERALDIRIKAFGSDHPDVADTLDRLGEFLAETGDYAEARLIYQRVLAITEKVHGVDHPHAGVVRQHLAEVLAAMGEVGGAVRMALDAEAIGREHLRLIGRTLPERDALMYAAMRPVGLDVSLSLLARAENDTQLSSEAVWDAVVRSRAVVLDEMASRHRTVAADQRVELIEPMRLLTAKREQLAKLLVRGPVGSGGQYRADLERARIERDEAERAVAERSAAFRQEQRQLRFGIEEMKAALPAGSALIAFVRYLQHEFGDKSGRGATEPTPAYIAFVMRAGESAEPAVIALGAAGAVDADIARWRKQVPLVALSGGSATAGAESALRRAGLQLRDRIWDSLATHLAGASRVFIVPDGSLHLVNWDALPTAGGRYLIEEAPPIHYLSAERDLAVAVDARAIGRGLLVVDSPMFDDRPKSAPRLADPTTIRSGAAAPPATGSDVARKLPPGCGDLGWLRFDPLPSSAREGATIAKIWSGRHTAALRLSGPAATEAAVKERAAGARVLHLATHGFFLGNRCTAAPDARAHEGNPSADTDNRANPLLLAGLALSGANHRQTAGPGDQDGVLTAEEVAALDLRGVEWAVLSGCDTGVGEVRAGEGVFGLRRAFQVAGARTVIMSLWPVDDDSARRWMTSVYEHRFGQGDETLVAVRQASLEQLRRRRAGLSTHPFYWAGFIAAGDWR